MRDNTSPVSLSIVHPSNVTVFSVGLLSFLPFFDTVTTIGSASFKNCSSLTSITIPASVEKIEQQAFWDSGLTEAIFENPEGWTSYCRSTAYEFVRFSVETMSDPVQAAEWLHNRDCTMVEINISDAYLVYRVFVRS